jgi:hypothetical protein
MKRCLPKLVTKLLHELRLYELVRCKVVAKVLRLQHLVRLPALYLVLFAVAPRLLESRKRRQTQALFVRLCGAKP